jgi:hypothetical protein
MSTLDLYMLIGTAVFLCIALGLLVHFEKRGPERTVVEAEHDSSDWDFPPRWKPSAERRVGPESREHIGRDRKAA